MHSRTRMSNSTVSFRMKSKKLITIAIFGLGTVGGGTLEKLLQKNSALIEEKTGYTIEVVKAVVRSPEKKRNLNLEKIVLSKEADFVLQDENIENASPNC